MPKRFGEILSAETPVAPEEAERNLLNETYEGSELFALLKDQGGAWDKPTGLFTDVDNTFWRADRPEAAAKLSELAGERKVPIVAVTGNDFAGLNQRIESGELPAFPAVIGSVGTEIWVRQKDGGQYVKDAYFDNLLKQTGFDRQKLAASGADLISRLAGEHPDWQLKFQHPEKENELQTSPDAYYQPYKISFYFLAEDENIKKMAKIAEEFFPDASIIICEENNHNANLPPDAAVKKYCLDVLPVSKADAVDYLAKVAGIEQGIVAGDSGNDVDMLVKSGKLNAVLVGGYKPEAGKGVLKNKAAEKSSQLSFQEISQPDGTVKAVYIEKTPALAAESIIRAAKIIDRAARWKKAQEKKQK